MGGKPRESRAMDKPMMVINVTQETHAEIKALRREFEGEEGYPRPITMGETVWRLIKFYRDEKNKLVINIRPPDFEFLQDRGVAAKNECNCSAHRVGECTTGWVCPIHGQMF